MSDYLKKRGEFYHYYRRVPAHLKNYDSRLHIRVSLKTKDPIEAGRLAAVQNDALEKYWRDLVTHKKVHGQDESWRDAVTLARAHGFAFRNTAEIAAGGLDEVVARMEALSKIGVTTRAVKALAGTAQKPQQRLTATLEAFFESSGDRLAGRTAHGARKWKNPRQRAVQNFETAVGERAIDQVTREDILKFRKWWVDRVINEGHDPGSGNKDFMHLKDVLRVVSREAEVALDIPALFVDVRLKAKKNSRAPFEAAFVQDKILKPGALDGLNEQARALVYIMADTGARDNEVIGLLPEDIFLDAPIPYIHIRPNAKRGIKTDQSERKIPLVGVALIGVKMVPHGFTRYASADSASAVVNKYLRDKGFKPSPRHTLYSLRHTFKDRLRDAGAPEEIQNELMGHASKGPDYGRGHLLETKLEWMHKIAFKNFATAS